MTIEHLTFIALFGGLAITLICESLRPRYTWTPLARAKHLAANGMVWLFAIALLFVVQSHFFAHAVSQALYLQVGLLPMLHAPLWLAAIIGFIAADFSDYVMHRASHRFRWLWLLHSVHHSDQHLDVSTSLRQHPLSLVFVLFVRSLMMIALGAPLWALALRDLCAVITSHLHHAAIAWSPRAIAWMERYLAWLIVPPTAHWLHHDPREPFTNSNFGQLFSCWDRLFGTYRASTIPAQPSGLTALSAPRWHTVWGMLTMPWRARRIKTF